MAYLNGTRLGLTILKFFPGTIRSAVLDSVLPPHVRYDEQSRKSHLRSLNLLLRDCEADPACHGAYPQLRGKWRFALARATQQGLRAEGRADKDSPPRAVVFGARSLLEVLPLNDTGSLAGLPGLLEGIADNQQAALSQAAQWLLQPGSYAWVLRYSVWCSEETPFVRGSSTTAESFVVSPRVCDAWHVRPVPSSAHARVRTETPVLPCSDLLIYQTVIL